MNYLTYHTRDELLLLCEKNILLEDAARSMLKNWLAQVNETVAGF